MFRYVDNEWMEWRGSYIFSWAHTPCWCSLQLRDTTGEWAEEEGQYERLERAGGTIPYAIDGLEFA